VTFFSSSTFFFSSFAQTQVLELELCETEGFLPFLPFSLVASFLVVFSSLVSCSYENETEVRV